VEKTPPSHNIFRYGLVPTVRTKLSLWLAVIRRSK